MLGEIYRKFCYVECQDGKEHDIPPNFHHDLAGIHQTIVKGFGGFFGYGKGQGRPVYAITAPGSNGNRDYGQVNTNKKEPDRYGWGKPAGSIT